MEEWRIDAVSIKITMKVPENCRAGNLILPYRFNAKNNTRSREDLRNSLFDDRLAINQSVGKILGTLQTLVAVPVQGNVTYSITPGRTQCAGEITCFDINDERRLNKLLRIVDALSFSLSQEYSSKIKLIRVTCNQTVVITPSEPVDFPR